MLCLGFCNHFLPLGRKKKGVTLIELLVGTVVFMMISFGGYQIFTKTTQRGETSQRQAKYSRSLSMFLEKFRHEIENTVQLPNAESSAFELTRPTKCTAAGGVTEPDGLRATLAWGLIPFPGLNRSTITNSLAPFDPSAMPVDNTTHGSDAVLLVYTPQDSVVNYLKLCPSGASQIACATSGPSTPIEVLGTNTSLEIGDYAIVADANRKELIRITGKTTIGTNTNFAHSATVSIWNKVFNTDIGNDAGYKTNLGQPIIFKVRLATYAHDFDTKQIVRDDHVFDDDFSPKFKTFGTPGLKLRWQTVATDITGFRVSYVRADDSETRTPQIGTPQKVYDKCITVGHAINCGCENEVGNPVLKNIKAVIDYRNLEGGPTNRTDEPATAVEIFNPVLLKKGLPYVGTDHVGCQTKDELFTTMPDGTPNPNCSTKSYCRCSDRRPSSLCAPSCPVPTPSPPTTNPPVFGGGGAG